MTRLRKSSVHPTGEVLLYETKQGEPAQGRCRQRTGGMKAQATKALQTPVEVFIKISMDAQPPGAQGQAIQGNHWCWKSWRKGGICPQ